MLSVRPVNYVQFRGDMQDYLSREGAYSANATPQPVNVNTNMPSDNYEKKSSSNTGKIILGTIIGAAVIAGGLWAMPKYFAKTFNPEKNLSNLQGTDKYISYVTTYIAKAGKWIDENCTKAITATKKFLHIGQ